MYFPLGNYTIYQFQSFSFDFDTQSKQAKKNISYVSVHDRQYYASCNKFDK